MLSSGGKGGAVQATCFHRTDGLRRSEQSTGSLPSRVKEDDDNDDDDVLLTFIFVKGFVLYLEESYRRC